jgi:neutral ceramidase
MAVSKSGNSENSRPGRTLAGAAKAVITPPVGYPMGNWGLRQGVARGVYRDIYARAVVFKRDETALAIVSLEIAGLTAETVQAIKARIFQVAAIPVDNVLLNFTHNHTSPDTITSLPAEWTTWTAWLADQVAGCVFNALNQAVPSNVGSGRGSLDGWTVNRQYPDKAIDTEIGVSRVDDDEGRPIARLVNFACHGVADGGQFLEWSGDFAGEMSAHIESQQPGSVAVYIQGAAGDIHPFDWWFGNSASEHLHSHEDTALFGRTLANVALAVASEVSTTTDVPLAIAAAPVQMPRHQVNWSLSDALANREQLREALGSYTGETWLEGTTTANSAEHHPELYGVGNNEVALAQNLDQPPVTVAVRGFRIGDTSISAHAGELFNELGSTIKQAFPGNRPWVASYCDDYIGYISTRQPHEEIADIPVSEIVEMKQYRRYYGTTTSPYAPEAGEALVAVAIDVLKALGAD